MKKYFSKKNIIIFIFCIVIILVFIIVFFNPFLYFKMSGKSNIDISVNEEIKLPKVNAYIFNNKIRVTKKGKVNTKKIGTYKIYYSAKFLFTEKTLTIKVNVLDKEKPIINLNGNQEVVLCPNTEYKEEGYSAIDNYDGDITDKVKIEKLEDSIKYSINDSSNNNFEIIRKLKYEDKESPLITLTGSKTIKIKVNNNYKENGYKASDNCDGDITSSVEVVNNINTSKIGKYSVTYKVKDKSGNEFATTRNIEVVSGNGWYDNIVMGPTYINEILIVNKKYALPKSYAPGVNGEAYNALVKLQNDAKNVGYSIPLLSGYRDYNFQSTLYNNYVKVDGEKLADTYSARPGHSEHQTGLAFDVGKLDDYYGETKEGTWLKNNAHKYGFIIRYPKGKEHITGYQYEPWHVRYLGVSHATEVYNKGITLEEYLGIN